MITYPATFPRPTQSFGEDNIAFALRTEMESGRVRERKRWAEAYTAYTLNFEMDTVTFSKWSKWAVNNAYDWFEMELDVVEGSRMKRELRFKAPFTFKYRNWNTVEISVLAEESNVLANPAPIPPHLTFALSVNAFGFGSDSEVTQPGQSSYACDAFSVYLASNATYHYDCQSYTNGATYYEVPESNGGPLLYVKKPNIVNMLSSEPIIDAACYTSIQTKYDTVSGSGVLGVAFPSTGGTSKIVSTGGLYKGINHTTAAQRMELGHISCTPNDSGYGNIPSLPLQVLVRSNDLGGVPKLEINLRQVLIGNGDDNATVNWSTLPVTYTDSFWLHIVTEYNINNSPGGGNELAVAIDVDVYINGSLVLSCSKYDTQANGYGWGTWTLTTTVASPTQSIAYPRLYFNNFYMYEGEMDISALAVALNNNLLP